MALAPEAGRRRRDVASPRRVSSSCLSRRTDRRPRRAMAESDWDTVTVLRKKGPTAAQAKSKQVPSQQGAAGSCRVARHAAVAGPSRGIQQWVGTQTDRTRVGTLGDNRWRRSIGKDRGRGHLTWARLGQRSGQGLGMWPGLWTGTGLGGDLDGGGNRVENRCKCRSENLVGH